MSTPHHDVVVVGFGPVGTVLSGLLAARGLDVLAVDRETEIYPLPRAAHFDHEIMRVFQELGCADEVAPATIVNPGMDFLTADREVLLRMRPAPTTPSGWPASILFHQPGLELPMREAALARGTATRLGVGVASVRDLGDMVEVSLDDGSAVTASYLVGCDGARSGVRKQLGIAMHDLRFEEPWLVLDLVLHEGTEPPSPVTLQVCDAARPHTLVPMPSPRFRFEFMLLEGETAEEISRPERVDELLATWMDPSTATVERSAVYTFHGLVAQQWRAGRILLAGDAAHMMPPFLGQGMCSGIRDAANLAWKLHAVLRGGAPDALLDTYQQEREPHVRAIVESAVGFGRLICTTDAALAAARDRDMLAARAAGGGDVSGSTAPAIPDGPLVRAGGLQAPQPVVDGTRLDDLVGAGFAVVARNAGRLTGTAADWWRAHGAVMLSADVHPEVAAVLDDADADVVVIRPDRYVLMAGATLELPDDVRALLAP